MNITLLGNCQTKALSWYIQELDPSFDVKWICIEKFLSFWGPEPHFENEPINVIADAQEGIKRLKSSDYVIFQPIDTKTSENYNQNKIQKHAKNSKLISISSFYYDPDIKDSKKNGLIGMIDRAEKLNIDIPAHKIIEKHGSEIEISRKIKKPTHPHVFYFLELVREICIKTGWNYYSKNQYSQYLKNGIHSDSKSARTFPNCIA